MAQILGQYHKICTGAETLELFYNDNLGSSRVVISNVDTQLDLFIYSNWGVVTHLCGHHLITIWLLLLANSMMPLD